jgi:hypothetical protein
MLGICTKTTQLDDVTLNNVNDFINTTQRGWKNWQVGARYNEEIPAIEAVIDYYQKFKDKIPTFVLFISDGGVGSRREMQKILTKLQNCLFLAVCGDWWARLWSFRKIR